MSSNNPIHYMQRALTLARCAEGRTSPNPLVGAVLVKDGHIVGEGYHHGAGQAHAEIEALHQAGAAARGATLYVTLEPCAHQGRTAPCTDALIEAGIVDVFYATADLNPLTRGQGPAKLRSVGIGVHEGLCQNEAQSLNQPFFKHISTGLPYVTAKFAMSLDGKIATQTGDSRWITNTTSRQRVHELRNVTDCILVGVGTILADDPLLTTRLPANHETDFDRIRHPLRIVVDSRGRIPLSAQILNPTLPGHTVLATTFAINPDYCAALAARGIEIWQFPADEHNKVSLPALLTEIGRRGMLTLLVEGGRDLLGSCFAAGVVDRVWAFVAPCIIGGIGAPGPVGGSGINALADALHLSSLKVESLAGDLWIEATTRRF